MANIYTDSHYTFGISHENSPIWRSKAFLASAEKTFKHVELRKQLTKALMLPVWVDIMKVKVKDSKSHMCTMENNLTVVTEFFLLGFQIRQSLRIPLFCLLLVVFCGTICGNLLITTLVSTTKSLQTPMYFFISQLSISDILVITNIVPNLLQILLNNGGSIAFIDCFTQLYFLCAPEVFECFLLAVMSYDRYVAICNPLRYSTIMTIALCVILSVICWMLGFSFVLIYIIKMAKLNFCGPNIIDHLFCDIVPLLDLSCSDTFIVHLEIYLMVIPIVIIPTIIIVLSYTYIISAVLKIKSSVSRQKAFSTCSSHLTVVSIFYWTMFGVYVFPTKGRTLTMSKILSLLYTVFTPFINPIIYSLRNQDIRKAILKHATWKCGPFPDVSGFESGGLKRGLGNNEEVEAEEEEEQQELAKSTKEASTHTNFVPSLLWTEKGNEEEEMEDEEEELERRNHEIMMETGKCWQ
ncbi:olfactory receptor 1500-like [Phyllobates terribilis]|uniref:olfactory receptor 1500-like n=1 Tax=Phyllobates terribilis TaxID=111132 RepID=UPI003CCA8C1A